jgi:uncharacterized protein
MPNDELTNAELTRNDLPSDGLPRHPLLSQELKDHLSRSVLCWLATIDHDGFANVSPKEIFIAIDQNILIAHVASPVSVRNIKSNPKVCVSFVDVFSQRGFKVTGHASILEPNDHGFDQIAAPLKKIATEKFPVKAVIVVEPIRIARILAPRYNLFADTTEAAQVARAIKTYNRVLERHGLQLARPDGLPD